MKYENKIYGYVVLNNEKFAFVFDNYVVRIFNGAKDTFSPKKIELPSIIFGITDDNYNIAFCVYSAYQRENSIIFSTPYFILDNVNCFNYNISSFDEIKFVGGCINQLLDPTSVYNDSLEDWRDDINQKSSFIKFKPLKDVSNEFELNILEKDVKLKYSITPYEKRKNNILGETNSYISIKFSEEQKLNELEKWYNFIVKLATVLILQQNVDFDSIKINYKVYIEDISKTMPISANVFVNTSYMDIADKESCYCINLPLFNGVMENLSSIIENNKFSIGFLPKKNDDVKSLTYENIKNICTAMEYEFDINKLKIERNQTIDLLKQKTLELVENFKLEHKSLEDDDYESIRNSIHKWSIPAKKQAYSLYVLHKDIIDDILYHNGLDFSYKSCSDLITCRNKITHGSRPKLSVQIGHSAYAMQIIIYVSLLKRIGLSDDVIKDTLKIVF